MGLGLCALIEKCRSTDRKVTSLRMDACGRQVKYDMVAAGKSEIVKVRDLRIDGEQHVDIHIQTHTCKITSNCCLLITPLSR